MKCWWGYLNMHHMLLTTVSFHVNTGETSLAKAKHFYIEKNS